MCVKGCVSDRTANVCLTHAQETTLAQPKPSGSRACGFGTLPTSGLPSDTTFGESGAALGLAALGLVLPLLLLSPGGVGGSSSIGGIGTLATSYTSSCRCSTSSIRSSMHVR